MSSYRFEQIRNIVLVGHGAVGKTTLADLFLFKAGIGTRAGSVDDGTSQLDFDEESRQRHFSISSAMVHFDHKGVRVNVIDTPGYPDFVGQAISALCAAETALCVVNAAAGLEANTRRTFQLAGEAGLARMIVINKLDQENLNFPQLIHQIQDAFGRRCIPLNVPVSPGSSFTRVVGTLEASRLRSSATPELAGEYGAAVMDAIVEADDELMERYLDGQELTADEVLGGATKAIALGTLVPIFCVSARSGAGVAELMDAIVDFALSPGELVRTARSDAGEDVAVTSSEDAPLIAQVFKTRIDPFVSRMSFIRVFSGRLTRDSTVRDVRTGRGVKIHQLLDVQGGHFEAVEEAHAGDVVAVARIDEFQVGDTLVSNGVSFELPHMAFPAPMIGLAVEPRSRTDQQKISGALHKIEEEDPTFHVVRDLQTHEMVMQGMSELHLQIVQERLHRREKVDVVTHAPRVPYRETILDSAEGSYRHKKQTGGSGQFAEVHLRVYPLEQAPDIDSRFTREQFPGLREFHYDPERNFAFLDCVSGGSVPNQFIPAVEKGVRDAMERGSLAGCPMQDLAVALHFGKDHPVDSNEAAFRTAASHCFREVIQKARPALLEPIVHLEVAVPGEKLGEVTSDLNTRRGRMEALEIRADGQQVIQARAPLAEVGNYGRQLSGLTGGQGSYTFAFSHYELMPPHEQTKVVAAQNGASK